MKVSEVLNILSSRIISSVKWKNDPSGLLVGNGRDRVAGILTALNPTLEVAKEAKKKGCSLIVSHHPLFKKPVNDLVEGDYYSDIIRYLIKNDISLISFHTSYDLAVGGVSYLLAEALGLTDIRPMIDIKDIPDVEINELYKIVVYTPVQSSDNIMKAIDSAGGASIGKYDHCYFKSEGEGSFRPGDGTKPFIGKKGKVEKVSEVRIETVVTAWNKGKVVSSVRSVHPYEEPVIDVYPLDNSSGNFGLGAVGDLKKMSTMKEFCRNVSEILGTQTLRIALKDEKTKISRLAVCGGSGSSSWKYALKAGADVFLTSEFSHHLYQEASKYINIIDATHYATEQFAKKGLKNYLETHLVKKISIYESADDTDVVKSITELK